MKNFHQNLLIILAICLCGLCAYQWYVQSTQRVEIDKLEQSVADRNVALQISTNTIKTTDHQITQMDAEISKLKSARDVNEQVISSQMRELQRLQAQVGAATNQAAEYKMAVDSLETKLKDAYENIRKQNDAVTQLAAQRDNLVAKFNDSIKDRNDIVTKYNDLVKQVERIQSAAAAAANDGGK